MAMKNIVDFEKTLTVDEAIAQSKQEEIKKVPKKVKKQQVQQEDSENINNQILNFGNKPIKRD